MSFTPDYVVGLVDGEGSFAVHIRSLEKQVKRRAIIEPRFYLKLQNRDKPILEALKEFFGCGQVYIQRDRRLNHQLCWRFEVANRKDLREKIIPFFLQHRLQFPTKRNDFRIFQRVLESIERNEHFTERGLAYLRSLAVRMH